MTRVTLDCGGEKRALRVQNHHHHHQSQHKLGSYILIVPLYTLPWQRIYFWISKKKRKNHKRLPITFLDDFLNLPIIVKSITKILMITNDLTRCWRTTTRCRPPRAHRLHRQPQTAHPRRPSSPSRTTRSSRRTRTQVGESWSRHFQRFLPTFLYVVRWLVQSEPLPLAFHTSNTNCCSKHSIILLCYSIVFLECIIVSNYLTQVSTSN